MDWLKDQKNQPFVIAGALVLIIGSIVFVLFQNGVFSNNSNPTPVARISPSVGPGALGGPGMVAGRPGGPGGPGGPPGAVGGPRMPGAAPGMSRPPVGGAPGGFGASGGPGAPGGFGSPGGFGASVGTTAAAKPGPAGPLQPINPATARDPFNITGLPGLKPKAIARVVKTLVGHLPSLRSVLPTHDIFTGVSVNSQLPPSATLAALPNLGNSPSTPYQVASLPRVSGIVNLNGIHAIIQSVQGGSQTVDPGDSISGVGRVTSIQPDGITVRTSGGQTIQIPVTAGNPGQSGPGYPGGGYPGAPGGFPGAPGGFPGGAGYNPGGAGYNPGGAGYNPGGAGYNPGGAGYNPGGAGYNPGGAG